jgi:SpoVK/Ycf46/Vps4 family AAA+-type ATPase
MQPASPVVDSALTTLQTVIDSAFTTPQSVIDSALTAPQVPSVAWEDIGGYEDVKQALREMIEVRTMLQPKHAAAPFQSDLGIAEVSRSSFQCA